MSHDDALDALISTAKVQDRPPEGAEDQAWAAFAGSLGGGDGGDGGGSDAPGAAEVATLAGAKGLAIKLAVGAVLASAATVGVLRWSAPSNEPPAEPTVSAERSPAAASVATPVPVGSPAVSAVVPPVAAPQTPTASVPVRPPPRARTGREPVPPEPVEPALASTLAEEARLVGSMWKALDGGDPERALSLAQSHGARFKGGELSLEARGAALAARCVLGRPTNLRELEVVQKAAAPAVAKRISAACTKKP